MSDPLDGARLKLGRAEQHLETIDAEIVSYMEEYGGARYRAEFDPADQRHVIYHESGDPLPRHWGTAVGDVLQNIRTALNFLVCELVTQQARVPHGRHQFPILKGQTDWAREVIKPRPQQSQLGWIRAQDVAHIERLQPYTPSTGLPILAKLRDLSNADKHRLLLASTILPIDPPSFSPKIVIPCIMGEWTLTHPLWQALHDGAEIGRLRVQVPASEIHALVTGVMPPRPTSHMDMDPHTQVTIVFGPDPKEGARISDLREMLATTRTIIDGFSSSF